MLDHITLRVSDLARSKAFYSKALQPLGYGLVMEKQASAGFGVDGSRDFWIHEGDARQSPHSFSCVAFCASSRTMVDEFYHAALVAGGTENGAPGYRPRYHPGYYAAYAG